MTLAYFRARERWQLWRHGIPVDCPTCGAAPGVVCCRVDGAPMFHPARAVPMETGADLAGLNMLRTAPDDAALDALWAEIEHNREAWGAAIRQETK